jgi:hypothetical protein
MYRFIWIYIILLFLAVLQFIVHVNVGAYVQIDVWIIFSSTHNNSLIQQLLPLFNRRSHSTIASHFFYIVKISVVTLFF